MRLRIQWRFRDILISVALCLAPFSALHAQDNADLTRLDTDNPEAFAFFDTIGLYDFLRIVAEESRAASDQVRVEFFPDLAPELWDNEMQLLFSPEAVVLAFETAWPDDALDADARDELMTFYNSAFGQQVVEGEIAAREGMADPGIEEAARSAAMLADNDGDLRLDRHADFSAELGLLDRTVTAMMNAQFQFLTGLSDGGGLSPPMPQEDLLRFIVVQADDLRAEAEAWMSAYQLMAYGGLTDEEFATFADLNTSPEGRALAAAVFAAFDDTFDALQYQLGLIAARYVVGDDI